MLTQYENIAVRLKFPKALRKQLKYADAAEERKNQERNQAIRQ